MKICRKYHTSVEALSKTFALRVSKIFGGQRNLKKFSESRRIGPALWRQSIVLGKLGYTGRFLSLTFGSGWSKSPECFPLLPDREHHKTRMIE
jgi:hypothetical protein